MGQYLRKNTTIAVPTQTARLTTGLSPKMYSYDLFFGELLMYNVMQFPGQTCGGSVALAKSHQQFLKLSNPAFIKRKKQVLGQLLRYGASPLD